MALLDFTQALNALDTYGLTDLFLPFLLIFSVSYAILRQVNILGDKKYDTVVALAMSLLTVVPHVTGGYPAGYDVVTIINTFLPNALLVVLSLFIFLVVLAGVSDKDKLNISSSPIISIIAFIALIALVFVFFGSVGTNVPQWLSNLLDPATQSLVIMLLVAGGVIYFITRKDTTPPTPADPIGKVHGALKKLFGE